MKELNVVVPMAGEGSRFSSHGYTIPKPFVEVLGTPMFMRAIQFLESSKFKINYIFVIQKKHVAYFNNIEHKLSFPFQLVLLDTLTAGAAETVLKGIEFAEKKDLPLLVIDSDLEASSELTSMNLEDEWGFDIGLHTFQSDDPRYSYVDLQNHKVVGVKEKKVISSFALAGLYLLRRTSWFIDAYKEAETTGKLFSKGEVYISNVINSAIESGLTATIIKMEKYLSFGTPEELKRSLHELQS